MEEGLIYQSKILHKLKLSDFFHQSVQHGYACAIYRLPQCEAVHTIIDYSGGENLENVDLENLGSGYIFHPFSAEHHGIKFLNQDIHIHQESAEKPLEVISSNYSEEDLLHRFGAKAKYPISEENVETLTTLEKNQVDINKSLFLELVNDSIREIEKNTFQKVVISRTKEIQLGDQFDAIHLFDKLSKKYKNAFVHLTYIPGIGIWAGATPETLISIDENNQFQTVALAATQAHNKDVDIADTTWSQKDIEEQAMVSRYIINCFKKIRLREFEEIGPRTYLSGNLVHLKTNYRVDMTQVNFPDLGSVMLDLLHPTSAVCGMPKEATQKFIEDNEGFDREYFSGYLGPVNIMDQTNIFVNLRCAKISKSTAQLFAGAGIIINSNPEKEWKETEIKMETILSVLEELQ